MTPCRVTRIPVTRSAPFLIALALVAGLLGPARASAAAPPRRGVDLFVGGGLSTDPHDDDSTGNIAFGAGYRGSPYWAVGLEGFRIKLTSSGMRILVGPWAKAYPFYNRFVNPYARVGVGVMNFESDDSPDAPDSRFNLVPELAVGLELGLPAVALFGEVSEHFGVRYGGTSGYDSIRSITVGFSVHFFGAAPGAR